MDKVKAALFESGGVFAVNDEDRKKYYLDNYYCAEWIYLYTDVKLKKDEDDKYYTDTNGNYITEPLTEEEKIAKDKYTLMITVDCGISGIEEVEYANSLGIETIITDHHEVPFEETEDGRREKLPPADVIINPKQEMCQYPWKGLCGGAGVL